MRRTDKSLYIALVVVALSQLAASISTAWGIGPIKAVMIAALSIMVLFLAIAIDTRKVFGDA